MAFETGNGRKKIRDVEKRPRIQGGSLCCRMQ